ncbi:hypothetical protein [Dyadobacter bucti]|uniref:hypothetical protein n=1 Tax=Dyadobacter bucti TaxID=2572203 RepID=UPI003F710AD6
MTDSPKELIRLQTFLLPQNYLQWQERWEQANPDGFKVYYADAESFEEVLYFLEDEFKSNIIQILQQFSQSLTQKRISELASKTGTSTDYCKYGKALRKILENVRTSKITSQYAEFLHKSFTETAAKLQDKLDIDVAYNTGDVASELSDETSASLESNSVSASTSSGPSSKQKRGKGKVPSGGYISLHPNPNEAIRSQFKFLDPRICSLSSLSEEEFEQFVLVTDKMIHQNITIETVGQFKKAANSIITERILTLACSDLKKTIFGKPRPSFYMASMANLFGLESKRFYKNFSAGELVKIWKNIFPSHVMTE